LKIIRRHLAAMALCCPLLLLSGCLWSTRKLPAPKTPLIEQSAAPAELVTQLNQRWQALQSLNASVEIQASVLKPKLGVATDYTAIRGIILMRKPELLRVLGRVPVIGTRAFDMVSDGKNFTLWIPSRNIAFKGSNTVKKRSANQLENLRPGFFLDALVVRGLEPEDWYGVVADSETVEDTARKHLFTVPEYILSISRHKPDSRELIPERVVTFHRDNLLPAQQDLYDSDGNLETQVFYYNYKDFGTAGIYPAKVVIKRPIEEIQIVLTVDKVAENQTLSDGQFVLEPTEGTKIQNLE
jgi:outer membrane lipoprotein-sorting protein